MQLYQNVIKNLNDNIFRCNLYLCFINNLKD